MSPDDTRLGDGTFASFLPPRPPAGRPIEIWAAADTAADTLFLLQPDGNGYTLLDPHNGWREIRRFAAYEAAYCWLTAEAYERADGH